ncbi:zinc-dependent alcohol dehydrogenase family protein [Chitinophaga filiformis]|uniref:Zinc-dependent alcohol dehydrogenase family protein n=1 Tax=Chitinophaga filiformis TaxID=104663 RepID=A0ABY4IBL0_CHIFI|nr:zinc-dependent alcohol dehydrogenase family protein [Chitinophaga filiformis]UPK72714.1 zinc-dependent alcohol dehydrogenase family protein [Chitinophaga filiformis]
MTNGLPGTMQAMVLETPRSPLQLQQLPLPVPAPGQVLIRVIACGVCRTDLHIIDGELPSPKLPLVPGHEIVGMVVRNGHGTDHFRPGDIVGVPWLGYTCGKCKYCLRGQENLCEQALFTGYTINGGYAEYTTACARYCFLLPPVYAGAAGAPLLCAGLIGYRSWQMVSQHAQHIGIYGFGAAAHILTQIAKHQHKSIYAFTRQHDTLAQMFAIELGAVWTGSSGEAPPVKLDAAIIFAPAGELIPTALPHLDKGGQIICGGIHMSDIPSFPYHLLWEERSIRSVANLTRKDGELLFKAAAEAKVTTTIQQYRLSEANDALEDLRKGLVKGAAVLIPDHI